MKLLLCMNCQDIVRLMPELRFCKCGRVCGMYEADEHHAVTNGVGIDMAIANPSLVNAINCIKMGETKAVFSAWLRPSEGEGNPRSRIDPTLGARK